MNNGEQSPPIIKVPKLEPKIPNNKTKSAPIQIPKSKWIPKGCEENPWRHLM